MPTMSLDELKQRIEDKYEPLRIPFGDGDVVALQQPMKLSKDDRTSLIKDMGQSDVEGEEYDEDGVLARLRGIITTVADDKGAAGRFLQVVGDDLAVLREVIDEYGKATQVGEPGPR